MTDRPAVLHDGEDFVLHHHPGNADYLLVTFVATHKEHSAASDYLFRSFAEAYDVPSLGIACRTRNFYLSDEIERVIEAATPILRQFKTVVVIGNSIGGYGALKFSRRLNATHVIAMAPPFSLHPDEPAFDDPAERSRLQNSLIFSNQVTSFEQFRGMAIRSQDVSGRVFILYNPLNPVDAHQMTHLRKVIAFEEAPLHQAHHDVLPSVEQPDTIAKIIDLVRTAEAGTLCREFRAIARTVPGCVAPMLENAMVRHPLLVHRVLRGRQISGTPILRNLDAGRVSSQLAYHLAAAGYDAAAFDRIEALLRERLGRPVGIVADQAVGETGALQPGRRYLLMSFFGTFLSVTRAGTRLALCWDPFTTEGMEPVFASLLPDGLVLQTVSRDGGASEPLVVNEELSRLGSARLGNCITLKTPSGFIAGLPGDGLGYGNRWVAESGHFLPIAVSRPVELVRGRAEDRHDAVPGGTANAGKGQGRPGTGKAARSVGGGWSRLFRFGAGARQN